MAKTVMGHGSSEMIEQLKAQAAAAQARPAPSNLPAAAPYSSPQPRPPQPIGGPIPGQMGGGPTSGGPMGRPVGGPMPGMPNPMPGMPNPMPGGPMAGGPMGGGRPVGGPPVPTAGSVAPTMMVPSGGMPGFPSSPSGPQGGFPPGPSGPQGGFQPGPSGPQGGFPPPPAPAPMPPPQPAPPMGGGYPPAPQMAPRPHSPSTPPYVASRSSTTPGKPIEPWKDSLRLHMFVWGGILLLAFLTPTSIEPALTFHWNTIIDGEGTAKLVPLLIAAAGLLSILLAAIPTSPPPRGLIAGFLGLTGILLPTLLGLSKGSFELPQILILVNLFGQLLLVPGLLLRNEYTHSILPRLLVTFGVLCILALYVVPVNDRIGIVELFDILADGNGKQKVFGIIFLLPPVLALASLLAWLPGSSSGAGKVFAWLWISLGAITLIAAVLINGELGEVIKGSPYTALMSWSADSVLGALGGGRGGAMPYLGGAAYFVLVGYGFATIIGKQLEH
jgi:hypothetical protein